MATVCPEPHGISRDRTGPEQVPPVSMADLSPRRSPASARRVFVVAPLVEITAQAAVTAWLSGHVQAISVAVALGILSELVVRRFRTVWMHRPLPRTSVPRALD